MYLAQTTNWGHFPGRIGHWDLEMLVFEDKGKPEYPEKNLRYDATSHAEFTATELKRV